MGASEADGDTWYQNDTRTVARLDTDQGPPRAQIKAVMLWSAHGDGRAQPARGRLSPRLAGDRCGTRGEFRRDYGPRRARTRSLPGTDRPKWAGSHGLSIARRSRQAAGDDQA